MRGPKLDPEFVKLLESRFPGLKSLLTINLGVTYIDPKKRDSEDTSIFVWGIEGKTYETSYDEYKQISVVDGHLSRVINTDDTVIDVIAAGKEYYYLYKKAIEKLPLGMFYNSVSDSKDVFKIDEARLASIREILMLLSDLDNDAVSNFKNKLRG